MENRGRGSLFWHFLVELDWFEIFGADTNTGIRKQTENNKGSSEPKDKKT